jgi:adenylate cyclase class 2
MQATEIELKFRVASLPRLEARLHSLGFLLETPRTFESNTLYDTPDRQLKMRGELLRIRRYGSRKVVTHKRHPDVEAEGTLYKVRIETESEVADADALAEIFTRLGYGPSFRYEKYRSEWCHPAETTAHLVLDETPIGDFAELEGPAAWIERTLAELAIDHADCLTESYGKLFLAWKLQSGSAAEHLTFDEIGRDVLSPAAAR